MARRRRSAALLLPLLLCVPSANQAVRAQEGVGIPIGNNAAVVAKDADLTCAGFISTRQLTPDFSIVGGEKEGEINWYSTSNIVYLNYGKKHGASVGENLYVLRQRGKYENPYTGKDLGRYVQELGVLRLIAVQAKMSIAEVVYSCDGMKLGDNVRPFDKYVAPPIREFVPLNRYDLPTGKLSGQIVLSRNQRDYLGTHDVVYLDIGKRQGVELGQYYTIYRRPGMYNEGLVDRGNPVLREDDDHDDRIWDLDNKVYTNGDFSIVTGPRKPDEIVRDRKGLPRKVVGEICIIRVEEKSATAIITRVTQEANIGDYVEMQ
jgi:hypothetical protein